MDVSVEELMIIIGELTVKVRLLEQAAEKPVAIREAE